MHTDTGKNNRMTLQCLGFYSDCCIPGAGLRKSCRPVWEIPCGYILLILVRLGWSFVSERARYEKRILLQQQLRFLSPEWTQTKGISTHEFTLREMWSSSLDLHTRISTAESTVICIPYFSDRGAPLAGGLSVQRIHASSFFPPLREVWECLTTHLSHLYIWVMNYSSKCLKMPVCICGSLTTSALTVCRMPKGDKRDPVSDEAECLRLTLITNTFIAHVWRPRFLRRPVKRLW